MKKFRNYLRKKRLFISKSTLNRFIFNNMKNKIEGYVLTVSAIKHYLNAGDNQEVTTRSKHLRMEGLNPPTTINECDEMITDLRTFYL